MKLSENLTGKSIRGTYSTVSESNSEFNNTWSDEKHRNGIPSFVQEWITQKVQELSLQSYPADLEVYFVQD